MSAGIYNFTIEQGTTVVKQFTYKDANGSPVDLSGYSASMQIRATYTSSGDPISSFTGSAAASGSEGLSIITSGTGSTKGTVELRINATTTSDYTFTSAVYDLEIKKTLDGTVSRLLQGSIALSPEVTKG